MPSTVEESPGTQESTQHSDGFFGWKFSKSQVQVQKVSSHRQLHIVSYTSLSIPYRSFDSTRPFFGGELKNRWACCCERGCTAQGRTRSAIHFARFKAKRTLAGMRSRPQTKAYQREKKGESDVDSLTLTQFNPPNPSLSALRSLHILCQILACFAKSAERTEVGRKAGVEEKPARNFRSCSILIR